MVQTNRKKSINMENMINYSYISGSITSKHGLENMYSTIKKLIRSQHKKEEKENIKADEFLHHMES